MEQGCASFVVGTSIFSYDVQYFIALPAMGNRNGSGEKYVQRDSNTGLVHGILELSRTRL